MGGYKSSLEAAGAVVLQYQEFGSYQGDWLALVRYDGQYGWIRDYFGSCSGCDAYESEIGSESHTHEDGTWVWISDEKDYDEKCEICQSYKTKVAEFGMSYLENLLTQEEVEAKVSENIKWDMEAEDMLAFVKEHSIHKIKDPNNILSVLTKVKPA